MNHAVLMHNVTYDGATIRVYHANKGDGIPRHQHAYAHLTICHAGSCVVRKQGRELVMTKDTMPVNLTGGEWHEIEAIQDETVFSNIFSEDKY
jgi:quercetin dioxygenase-like cupin family protein